MIVIWMDFAPAIFLIGYLIDALWACAQIENSNSKRVGERGKKFWHVFMVMYM